MGLNAILLCKDVVTQAVDNIQSTDGAVHTVDVASPANIGSTLYGSAARRAVHINGYNPAVNNVLEDLWAGPTNLYLLPPSPIQMRVVSTSADDTALGTGIRTVSLYYLDTDYNEHVETITLDGLTPVLTTATNILRVNFFHAVTAGINLISAGTISVTNIAATTTYAVISTGVTTSRQGVYTVPAGYNLFLTDWSGSSGTITGAHFTRIILAMTQFNGTPTVGVSILQQEIGTLNGGTGIHLSVPIKLFPGTVLRIAAISDAANADAMVVGTVSGYLEQIV